MLKLDGNSKAQFAPLPPQAEAKRFIRLPEVRRLTGVGSSFIYEKMAEGEFPRSIKISPKLTVWRMDEVLCWMETRVRSQPSA